MKIYSTEGVCTISFESEDEAYSWMRYFKRCMRFKYNKKELLQKRSILKELEPLFEEQGKILDEKYDRIVTALEDSGFFIDSRQKKLREGYLSMEMAGRDKQWKKLYVVLYKSFIYLFKPHERVSVLSF